MNLELFKNMDHEGLLKYLEFLFWHDRVVDAFWFLYVEKSYGRETAEKLDKEVSAQVGPMTIKELKRYFNLEERGLEGLEKALRLFPWTNIGGHQIRKTDSEIILTVPHCPPQVARLERGLGEFDCKDMHRREFINIAKEIDPLVKVKCDFAPPDPHPEDLFCKWRFTILGGAF